MDDSFYLANLRKSDVLIGYDSNCPFLIVCRIRPATVLCRLELRKSVILFARFAKSITESSLQVHLHVCKSKTVHLPEIWIFILILGRRNSRKLACGPVAFNLVGKHEIIDLTATAKGLREHGALFSCRIHSVLNCLVCHLSLPVTVYTA